MNRYEIISAIVKVILIIIGITFMCLAFYDYGKNSKKEFKPLTKCIHGTTWTKEEHTDFYFLDKDTKKCIDEFEINKGIIIKGSK